MFHNRTMSGRSGNGVRVGTFKKRGFYDAIDLKEYGLWVGRLRDCPGIIPDPENTYRAYYYEFETLSRPFEAKNWEEAIVIGIRLHYRACVQGRSIKGKRKKQKAE